MMTHPEKRDFAIEPIFEKLTKIEAIKEILRISSRFSVVLNLIASINFNK